MDDEMMNLSFCQVRCFQNMAAILKSQVDRGLQGGQGTLEQSKHKKNP